ncbi:MAG: hypothetical protein V1888_03525 [archaeon]
MIDVQEKKNKIISFLKISGPSLPVKIAKIIEMDPVFASAILSELLDTNQIKTSHLKIGASPLYFIPGQEQKLEDHTENLKPLEKQALLKLKENKTLTDENEEPSIRVALRNIRDFAIPFKSNDKIMWEYAFPDGEKSKEKLTPQIKKPEPAKEPVERQQKIENIFEKEEPKPEFLNEVKLFLQKHKIEFIEEIQSEKKEIVAKVNIKSTVGDIHFLLIAKNKRTISQEEISASIQRAQYSKMPCLLILRKEPTKSIQKIIDKNHLIKLQIMQP